MPNDTITDCPSHLESHLTAARARWAAQDIDDCRAHQAAEVLQHAAGLFRLRSQPQSEDASLGHAWLGAWLAEQADAEDAARRAMDVMSAEAQAQMLGALTVGEINMILQSRRVSQEVTAPPRTESSVGIGSDGEYYARESDGSKKSW